MSWVGGKRMPGKNNISINVQGKNKKAILFFLTYTYWSSSVISKKNRNEGMVKLQVPRPRQFLETIYGTF